MNITFTRFLYSGIEWFRFLVACSDGNQQNLLGKKTQFQLICVWVIFVLPNMKARDSFAYFSCKDFSVLY